MKWVLIFGAWNLVTVFFAVQMTFRTTYLGNPVPFWRAFPQHAVSFYIWFAFTPAILWLWRRYPLNRQKWFRNTLIHLCASSIFSFLHLLIELLTLRFFPLFYWVPERTLFSVYMRQVVFFFHLNLFYYWGTFGIASAISYYRMYRERELRAAQLETRLAQSRLQMLLMQLQPHFLFNTLHTISATMHRDVEAADTMITHLSDMLRLTLENIGAQEVTLKQELGLLERYLQIEEARFRERLEVNMQIAPATLDARVPNMLLQPLVENAIRHGIERYAAAGRIEIISKRNEDMLCLEVSDNGPGLSDVQQPVLKEGVGLSNTQARLHQLYGSSHRFELRNRSGGGLLVRINLPFHEEELQRDGKD